MNNIYKKFNNKSSNITFEEAFNDVLRDATILDTLPDEIKKSPEFLSNLLHISPFVFNDASKKYLEKDTHLLKQIITEPIPSMENRPFEVLSLASDKIKTRDFCLEMVLINPYNIRHVPKKFLYDSDFIEAALKADGATVQFMESFVKQNEEFGLMAVQNNGFALKYFSPQVINSREVLLTALNTKGFSLSQFDNPELMCHDSEIAEKALKADPKAIQFFTKDNPLLKDKYFAIKMIPYNAKFFALFDQEIRHDPDTLLQIVKGKSVENILYIVSQEFTLYPKFFLFALDAYQKCLNDEEKQNNFGFYYYLHTSLFKERQKKFNIAYRRNLERKKALADQEEQKEIERRKQAQAHISKTSDFTLEAIDAMKNNSITEDNSIPNLLIKESVSIPSENQIKEAIKMPTPKSSSKANNGIGNGRLNDLYKIQSSKDFSNINSSKTNTYDEEDDFSHLVNLADEILPEFSSVNETNNDKADLSISNIDNPLHEEKKTIAESGFVSIGDNNLSSQDEHVDGITTQTFVDFQYYPSDKVKKANQDLNNVNLPPIEIPKSKQIVPDVTRYQEPTIGNEPSVDDRLEPTFDDSNEMSPAQNAAQRAFGNRTRPSIAPDVKDENDYIHRPVKRETTKKGSMSIFNFKKEK